MASNPIYLCHPNSKLNPLISDWVVEVRDLVANEDHWQDWHIVSWQYDMSCSVQITDVSSVVISAPGPCILIRNVQQKVITGLRKRLYGRSVVLVGDVNDPADLIAILDNARDLHLNGDPMLPRKVVVALLLVAKLEKHQMWGGRNKGYMWVSDIPKGRGIDEKYSDQVPAVINDLLTAEMLIFKVSQNKRKYALNPELRTVIHDVLRNREFPPELQEILDRDLQLESARQLDDLYEYYYAAK